MIAVKNGSGYNDIFKLTPSAILIIDVDAPAYTILDVNEAYLNATNSTRKELVGHSVFGAFPANPTDAVSENIERTIFSFEQAILHKKTHTMRNYRYDIPIRGTDEFEERYWTTSNTPVLDANGNVLYLIHSPENVTELFLVTQREKAGVEALKIQREQLFSTFMQAPVGIGIFKGQDYIVELINPPLCELYNKSMEDLIGKPIFEVLPEAKGIGFEELLKNVIHTGTPFKGNGLMVPIIKNGVVENVYVNFVYEPFREIDGSISGVLAIATEVTEQVNARKKLEEAEERARLAIAAVGLGTFDLDLTTGEMITSTLFANIFGFNEPVPRSEYVKAIHPDDQNARKIAHKDALHGGALTYEMRILWKDGTTHWGRVEGKVLYDPPTKPIRILGTILDITEQKQFKEEQQKLIKLVAESEELLRNITSAAPTGLWMSDENGSITYVNQTWIDWSGNSFENNLGAGWADAIVEEDREMAANKFLSDLNSRKQYEVEFRINHSDGKVHWCIATGRPQYNDGKFSGYIGACMDVTEQKILQQQKDDFIGIASHELKTPVTSIKAYTQILEKILFAKGSTKEAEMVGRMDKQLNRLTNLIRDLLDVTKINSGRLQFNDAEFDFKDLVTEVVQDLQQTTERYTIETEIDDIKTVFGDRERIGQVIINFITNALKYSPTADKIKVKSKIEDGNVILSVQDYGIGISEENLQKVFEQFFRVSGEMQHTFPGLGLGLYISSEIIKREGGKLWAVSKLGEGSTFSFSLPIKREK